MKVGPEQGVVASICSGEGMWARAVKGGVWKPVHSPTELSARLASGLPGTAPADLRLERALSAGALCSTELAGLTLGRALRAGALGRASGLQ